MSFFYFEAEVQVFLKIQVKNQDFQVKVMSQNTLTNKKLQDTCILVNSIKIVKNIGNL